MPTSSTHAVSPAAAKLAAPRATRSKLALMVERVIEVLVYACGISAIVFVFGIFFFVFKEGAPFLAKTQLH
jgi:ABC-type phosphate transport system permease subunit